MEPRMLEHNTQAQQVAVIVGKAINFRGFPEPGHKMNRPLMVNAWSQTAVSDFAILQEFENKDLQSQREKELEAQIKVLQEDLKAHAELLSQIHATSARTSALLGQQQQQQPLNQHYVNTLTYNGNSVGHNFGRDGASELSPNIVNGANAIDQGTRSPTESVKYRIIAEGTGNHNDEPIEIQLAEDDGALNLNSSADSGRLEICLGPEDNVEIKTEYNTANNMMTMTHQSTPPSPKHCIIKKRKIEPEQNNISSNNFKDCNVQTPLSINNKQLKSPNAQRPRNKNKSSNTPKMQHNHSLNTQTTPTTPNNTSDVMNGGVNVCHNGNVMITLGPNNTRIPAKLYANIDWGSASIATRKLLMALFDREILATHSMTGKPSPAFKGLGKPVKRMLDRLIVDDIIYAVTRKCNVSSKDVRTAITTKCADENKMMKMQLLKQKEANKENLIEETKENLIPT